MECKSLGGSPRGQAAFTASHSLTRAYEGRRCVPMVCLLSLMARLSDLRHGKHPENDYRFTACQRSETLLVYVFIKWIKITATHVTGIMRNQHY